jgi:uncharacterized membrane protein
MIGKGFESILLWLQICLEAFVAITIFVTLINNKKISLLGLVEIVDTILNWWFK